MAHAKPACGCGRRHNIYWDTVAVIPFVNDKPSGFRARGTDTASWWPASKDEPVHPTRAEAMTDVCEIWAQEQTA